MRKVGFICMLVMLLSSCYDKGYITVQNKVHNATLSHISWADYSLVSSLSPGEKSLKMTVSEKKKNFPKSDIIKFYMQRGENQVYLETKYSFTVDADQHLIVTISDTTSVINPLTME